MLEPADFAPARTQFESTRKWNLMLTEFYRTVPLNHNRYFFRNYSNTFSGREAVDAMQDVLGHVFPDREADRSIAAKVLEKLLEQGLIVGATASIQLFADAKDSFYRFDEDFVQELLDADENLPKRSVSLDEAKNFGAHRRRLACTPAVDAYDAASTSSSTGRTDSLSSMHVSSSTPMFSCPRADRKVAVNVALFRFIQWVSDQSNMSECEREKLVKKFKTSYPCVYNEYLKRKSTERLLEEHEQSAINTEDHLVFAERVDNSANLKAVGTEVLKQRLLDKLEQVCVDCRYTEAERNKILRYIYRQYFPKGRDAHQPLLKRIRSLFPV